MRKYLRRLRRDSAAATSLEYAFIVLFIGLVLISLQQSIGDSVRGFFEAVGNGL